MSTLLRVVLVGIAVLFAGCGTTTEVVCARGSDCAAGMACISGACVGATTCSSSRQCPDLVCNTTLGMCVECNGDADCPPSLSCVDSVCAPPTGMDGGDDGGRDGGIDAGLDMGIDAFVLPMDMGPPLGDVGPPPMDTAVDAFSPPDAFMDDTTGCDPGLRYCSGHCVDTTSDPTNCSNCGIACPAGYACVSSGCMCVTRCAGVCSDTSTDVNNCGACGHACDPGDFCRASRCFTPPCPAGQIRCGPACVDPSTDPLHCGSCTNACSGTTPYCVGGACTGSCAAPLDQYGAQCRELASDPTSCGNFGYTCRANEVCRTFDEINGAFGGAAFPRSICTQACDAGLTQCGRACVNLQLSQAHCGSCNHPCAPGEYCANGTCASCPAGQILCGASCVDPWTDPTHCGSCTNACSGTAPYCVGGACVASCSQPLDQYGSQCRELDSDPGSCGNFGYTCRANEVCRTFDEINGSFGGASLPRSICTQSCGSDLTQCGRACVNLQLSETHCGSCSHACNPGEYCANGTCASCPAGQILCGPSCVDPWTDPMHCGSCTNACSGTAPYCVGGACVASCSQPLDQYGAQCRELDSDPGACGNFGYTCRANEVCRTFDEINGSFGGAALPRSICTQSCGDGLTQCGRACVNPQLSQTHCGSCNHACGPGEYCANGTCSSCPAGQILCGPNCVDPWTDPGHCGSCTNACSGTAPYCVGGACVASCSQPLDQNGAQCRELDSDPGSCGNFGYTCRANEVCRTFDEINGSFGGASLPRSICTQACGDGLTQCGRACVNVQLSQTHCGSCGHACDPGQYCANGTCSSCPAGQILCGLSCIDPWTDPAHCGSCATACGGATSFCVGGACVASCPPPLDQNGFQCRELDSDPGACGNFGWTCRGNEVCRTFDEINGSTGGASLPRSICTEACGGGLTQCGRACVNLQLSQTHCGSCSHACAPGEYCVGGTCAMATGH